MDKNTIKVLQRLVEIKSDKSRITNVNYSSVLKIISVSANNIWAEGLDTYVSVNTFNHPKDDFCQVWLVLNEIEEKGQDREIKVVKEAVGGKYFGDVLCQVAHEVLDREVASLKAAYPSLAIDAWDLDVNITSGNKVVSLSIKVP